MAALAVCVPVGATAQAPLDLFGTHFGAVRRPVIAQQLWASLGAMLLTQFDGRFEKLEEQPGDPAFIQHDGLDASVAYNYLTVGGTLVATRDLQAVLGVSWIPAHTSVTASGSLHYGKTEDSWLTRPGQEALHDFRGVTRNYRGNVVNGYGLHGADVEVLVWPESRWLAIGGHASLVHSFHGEYAAKLVLTDRGGNARSHLTSTFGWLRQSGPTGVANHVKGTYLALAGGIEYLDRYGVTAAYDSGLFPDEREVLVSLFVAIQIDSKSWLRIEFVNDLLGGKDRGPTGGGRLALAYTY